MTTVPDEIREVWSLVPSTACDGRCADYCTAVPMSGLELSLVRSKMPWYPNAVQIAERLQRKEARCPALDANGRCGVYDVRPTVCRIFGTAESLPCPYGCEPDGGLLSREEASFIMDEIREIGGPLA